MVKGTVSIPISKLMQVVDTLEQLTKVFRAVVPEEAKSKFPIPTLQRPNHVPKGQAWFWSKKWQQEERRVNEALQKGDYEIFDSTEELLADLHSHQ